MRAIIIVSSTAALVVLMCAVGVCVVSARRKRPPVRANGGIQLVSPRSRTGTATGRPLHTNAMFLVVGEPCGHGFVAEGVAVPPPRGGAAYAPEAQHAGGRAGEPRMVVAVLDDLTPFAASGSPGRGAEGVI